MHPLAAPGALWVLSRAGKVPRPPAGGRNLSQETGFLRRAMERSLLSFFCFAGGFASAEATKGLSGRPLETFGSPCSKREAGGTAFLWKARERAFLARGFRLCGGDQGAFRSPPGSLRELSAPTSVALAGSFCAYQPKNTKTTNASPLSLFPHSPSKDIGAAGIHLSCPGEIRKDIEKKKIIFCQNPLYKLHKHAIMKP